MITYLFTKYHPRFIRSLVYMLQASEYQVYEYLKWFWRTTNFLRVEHRKTLDKTPKAQLLLIAAWFMVMLGAAFLLWLISLNSLLGYGLALIWLWILPYVIAHALIIPLALMQVIIQKPIERKRLAVAKKILGQHTGLKIAIAGSYGKTSMREILKTVLSAGKSVAAPPDSHNTPLAIAEFARSLTGEEEVLIFELGEYYPGDIATLCELIDPDIGVITGVNEAHLEKFKTLDVTQKTIFELAEFLVEKPVYVNAESEYAVEMVAPEHIQFSRSGVAEATVTNKKASLEGVRFALTTKKAVYQLNSQLLGLHQVGPLALAAVLAEGLGLKESEIIAGVRSTKAFAHRLEKRVGSDGVVTLDDSYNGNPDGVKAVIEFLALLKDVRRLYVTPGLVEMGEATELIHEDIGRWLAEAKIDKVVLIRNSVTPFIQAGLEKAGFSGELVWYDDAVKALTALPNLTIAGDVVLIQNDWPDQYV